jgi:hypothetical protein
MRLAAQEKSLAPRAAPRRCHGTTTGRRGPSGDWLWLGHESVETTQIYLDADLALKEQALAKTNPVKSAPKRFQPDDELLAFLKQL